MKTIFRKTGLSILMVCMSSLSTSAQITSALLQQFISENKYSNNAEIKEFYTKLNYSTAWIQKENAGNRTILLSALKLSGASGLLETDYQFNYIGSFQKGNLHFKNTYDSLEAEVRITDAAIHFYSDLVHG